MLTKSYVLITLNIAGARAQLILVPPSTNGAWPSSMQHAANRVTHRCVTRRQVFQHDVPQAFDGLALGSAFVRANFGWKKYCAFAVIFVLITPIGIAIGMGISTSYAPGSKAALGTEAVFNSVSAGQSSSQPVFALLSIHVFWRSASHVQHRHADALPHLHKHQ